MRDKSVGIFLMVIFGISGIAILMLTWIRPMLESERILSALVGLIVLFGVLIRALILIISSAKADIKPITMEVEDKP